MKRARNSSGSSEPRTTLVEKRPCWRAFWAERTPDTDRGLPSGVTGRGRALSRLCDQSRLSGLGVSKYGRKFIQVKRLPDKVRDWQPSEGGVDMLPTIGTRENYLHIRRGLLDPV